MSEEKRERQYLSEFLRKIEIGLAAIDDTIQLKKQEIDDIHTHMEEHKRDMDHLDKNALREVVRNYSLLGEHSVETKKRLLRLRDTAYFGRIDFTEREATAAKPIYVGVHHFQDPEANQNLVHDWRAPISSLFYDYELGEGQYQTKLGTISGDISLKRQFRIRQGEMEYMLDTDVTIYDDVLQRELNRASSAKMKNIVATIQKEQNAIIRDEEARYLIIQGVAGSGKTSIALHRIAFLLYRFKETISSDDVLIISPNKVFASYISNVLPELGEETVAETSMEEIADEIFEYQIKFQPFREQVAELLEKNDPKLIERIQFKSTPDILKKIDQYLLYLENEGFEVSDIWVKGKPVPAWFIRETFQRYSRMPILKRFNEVVREVVENLDRYYQLEVQYKDRTDLHKTIRQMFPSYNPRVLYKNFYQWLGRPDLLKLRKGSTYEWSDVYVFLYFKMKLEGIRPKTSVKHLVIDEMQDYSAVQYRVLSTLYPCKKTILGDINQSVNPFSASDLETIEGIFSDATSMTLLKSYRATYEITEFTKRISGKVEVEAIERHGEAPQIIACQHEAEELAQIKGLIANFEAGAYNSMGIICKTQKQADELYEKLKDQAKINVLNAVSVSFGSGIVITTAHLAKGLEFDEILVPFCTEKNYQSEPDRQMLYVACTRAMHKLYLTHTKKLTQLIEKEPVLQPA
jgi:DNA helicase II / ATP-dependent DNA helicase PcrA